MAYYDKMIAAWNSSVQPPTGVTGNGLTSSMPTETKLGFFNAWTVTGSIPTTINSNANEIANCVVYSEFKALSSSHQQNFLGVLNIPGPLQGGSDHTTNLLVGMIIDYFGPGSGTITNMVNLSKASVQPWWQVNGYGRPFDMGDVAAAGVS